jgi:hypothetical protein
MSYTTEVKNALVKKADNRYYGDIRANNILTFCAKVEAAMKLGFSDLIAARYETEYAPWGSVLNKERPYVFRMRKKDAVLMIYYTPSNYQSFIERTKKYNLIP